MWFKNWVSLQSVRGVDHVHVLVRDVPEEVLGGWLVRRGFISDFFWLGGRWMDGGMMQGFVRVRRNFALLGVGGVMFVHACGNASMGRSRKMPACFKSSRNTHSRTCTYGWVLPASSVRISRFRNE